MSFTVAQVRSSLSRYAGSGNTFLDRLNEVRARYLDDGNYVGSKTETVLAVYSDKNDQSIVTPPNGAKILGGALRNTDNTCSGTAMGVQNAWSDYNKNGLGWGAITEDYQEVTGRFCIFQEWSDSMLLRFKFETTEASGVIHIRGTLDGDKVYSLYSGSWIEGEKVAFSGTTTVTSTKYFDPDQLSIVKPVTLGRVSMYVVDSDGNETLVAVYAPDETVPRWKRYRVQNCDDVSSTTSSTTPVAGQYYTKAEMDSMFSDEGTITVSTTSSHDLVYAAYFLRIVKVVGAAGSGSYTHDFLLDNSTAKNGATLRIVISVAASANPHLKFWDNVASGSPLEEVDGDSSNAINFTLVFSYNGTNWKSEGREL